VARAGKYNRLDEKAWPFFYLPYTQGVPDIDLSVAVRTEGDPLALARAVESAIHEIDPAVNVLGTKSLEGHTEAIYFAQRVATILLSILGGVGLVLACMGVYAVTNYAVSRRTQEFGLRAAIGATEADLVTLVVRQGVALAVWGSLLGLVLALGLARMLSAFLYGVSPFDPVTFLAVPTLLVLLTATACLVPARRASRVDPMVALRCE
jgi:ABC-type antimicrobial peptide transport system permease subunit